MKTSNSVIFLFGAAVTLLTLTTLTYVISPQNSIAQTPPLSSSQTSAQPTAAVAPPPSILPSSPLAQVARLTQAGVDQGVIMTYVTNSESTFNLDSDKIIYLSNLGVPSGLITAMMQRDQQLQAQFTAAQAAQLASQTQQAQTAPTTESASAETTDVAAPPQMQPAPVTVDYFYDSLSPYGSWVDVAGYGRCWRPTVVAYDSSWQPYCDRGHWVYTDYGWYWASDYAWGVTFHYGRWFRDASFGWCWYPDTVWAPSWVTWRYSDNYCGWAPLPPRTGYQAGVGIVYDGGGVSVDFNFRLGASSFTFVPIQNFCDPHPRNYRVASAQVSQLYNNTTIINNYNINNHIIVNHGISVQNIAAATRTTIRPVPVREINGLGAHTRTEHIQEVNLATLTGNSSSFGQPPAAPQNHFPQPQHDIVVATIPQYSKPQAMPEYGQQTGTPHNNMRNYESHQNYYHSFTIAAPQSSPTYAPASEQSQSSGYHNGDQNWPGH
jgi:hypothetical protein